MLDATAKVTSKEIFKTMSVTIVQAAQDNKCKWIGSKLICKRSAKGQCR